MALARIITRSAEEAQGMAGQLQARGFAVEIVSPEQAVQAPADLLIQLDECSVEEALNNATLSPEKDLSVLVAPGAIAGTPTTAIPLVNSAQGTPAAEEQEGYVYQDAILSPLQRLRLPRIKLPHFSWPQLRLPRISVPRPSVRLPRMRLQPTRIAFRFPKIALRMPKLHVRVPRLPHLSLPRIKMGLTGPLLSIRKRALQVPCVTWQIPPVGRVIPKFSLGVRRNSIFGASVTTPLPRRSVRPRVAASNARFWGTALAFGIIAVSVLMVGGLLHSRTPLPTSLTQRPDTSGQRTPFAAVKPTLPSAATTAGAVVNQKRKATRLATPELAGERKPSPQITQRATKSGQRRPTSNAVSGRVKLAQRSRSTAQDGDYVAEDVVVHYGKKN